MNDFDVVKQHYDLLEKAKEHSYMRRQGREFVGLCPFHDEKTPSFHVNTQKQLFHCYGCGAGGDIVEFARLERNTDPFTALEILAEEKGIRLSTADDPGYQRRKSYQKKQESLAEKAESNLQDGLNYLYGRGLEKDTIIKFKLGYGKKHHSIIIPLIDKRNMILGYAERFIGDPPEPYTRKYKLPSENPQSPEYNELFKKNEFLYNEHNARKALKQEEYLLVFEGQFDVMAADQVGFGASVACMQSTLTNDQAKKLLRMAEDNTVIVLVPDKNEAGKISVRKNYELLRSLNQKIPIKVMNLPLKHHEDGKEYDFNDFMKSGVEQQEFISYIHHVEIALIELMIEQTPNFDLQQENARDIAQNIKNPFVREEVSKRLAEIWQTDIEKVDKLLSVQRTSDLFESFKDIDAMYESFMDKIRQGNESSIYLGYAQMDQKINMGLGIPTGWIVNFMARSSVGKTAFALNVIMNAIKRHKVGCTFFSFEQQDSDIYPKLAAIHMQASQKSIFESYKDMGSMVHEDLSQLLKNKLMVFDNKRLNLEQIESALHSLDEKYFVDTPNRVVLIDYLGYIKSNGIANKYEALSELTSELKQVAKRTNKVFIVLVQTSRDGKDGSEPVEFSHARDSGTIEENADILLGAFRPELSKDLDSADLVEVLDDYYIQLLKNRNGPQGLQFRLRFEKTKQIIREWETKEKEVFVESMKKKIKHMDEGEKISFLRSGE